MTEKRETADSMESREYTFPSHERIGELRFDRRIPDEVVMRTQSFFEQYNRETMSSEDVLTQLEHQGMGSSSPASERPLLPYALASGRKSLDEVLRVRTEKFRNDKHGSEMMGTTDFRTFGKEQETGDRWNDKILMSDHVRQKVQDLIATKLGLTVESLLEKNPRVGLRFYNISLSKDGTVVMPNLWRASVAHQEIQIPAAMRRSIKLGEYKAFFKGSPLANLVAPHRVLIDKHGWRFDYSGA